MSPPPPSLSFTVHPGRWAVARLDSAAPIPPWALAGPLASVTRTPHELSVVCPQSQVPPGQPAESDWACLQLIGPFPFSLTGILASFLNPLAQAQVPIFALSTFDTDWILVPAPRLQLALQALRAAGHNEV